MFLFKLITLLSLAALAGGFFWLKGKFEDDREATKRGRDFLHGIESLMRGLVDAQNDRTKLLTSGVESLERLSRIVRDVAEKLPDNPSKKANQATLDAVRELVSRV